MAMIKCPECGNMISDKGTNCVHCGTPLQVDKTVKIKIPKFNTGIFNQKSCAAELYRKNVALWKGFSGQVANIEIESEKTEISILIKKAYTGHPFPFFRDFTITGTVAQGKKYEIKMTRAALIGGPTKSDWALSEVDVIDSGI